MVLKIIVRWNDIREDIYTCKCISVHVYLSQVAVQIGDNFIQWINHYQVDKMYLLEYIF